MVLPIWKSLTDSDVTIMYVMAIYLHLARSKQNYFGHFIFPKYVAFNVQRVT